MKEHGVISHTIVIIILNAARILDFTFENNVTQERIFIISLEISVS
jgi:hypothetical protein